MENIDFSGLCRYLYLDLLTSDVESDETDESIDDTLGSVSFHDSTTKRKC